MKEIKRVPVFLKHSVEGKADLTISKNFHQLEILLLLS